VSDTGTRKIARGKLPINPILLDAERRWLFPARSYAVPRNPPGRERPIIQLRLPVLGAIALMIFNCGVAVAEPNQTSADYVMSRCRDAASLIAFSNVRESEEEAYRKGLCAGIIVGLSFMGQPQGICVPAGTTTEQATSIVVQYIDAQPARIHEDFNRFAVEALRANWPCSLVAGARDPLAVVPH
jgi:hypothetical protein